MGYRVSRRPRAIGAAAVLLGLLAGCGGATSELLDEAARKSLHTQVENVRSALGDQAKAKAALDKFRAEVSRLRADDELAAADADVLLTHADQIEQQVRAEAPKPSPSPSPTPSTKPLVVIDLPKLLGKDEGKPGKDEKKPGKGEGKGGKGD